eukprot:TRINITY_DN5778_c0_g1_i1.p1 TRINITY_DN5778_c0_g1~~TRINITY_DN5778_c0_g1_i1.p1  ORF type:complete len:210 (+),score=30.28 TRINITY_DN5778_c0_g1_i1:128-757(+)
MLLAVEGGGFFSSSASGYSNGLTLLLLGRKNEERPMRVSPWNQYQLVDREPDPDVQLASVKNRGSRGCASFVCFGRASTGHEGPSLPKVGPVHQPHVLPDLSSASDKGEACVSSDDGDDRNQRKSCLKNSLKKPSSDCPVPIDRGDEVRGTSEEKESNVSASVERRKVQWTDKCGGELVEIREFDFSDAGESDEEFESKSDQSCACVIQ